MPFRFPSRWEGRHHDPNPLTEAVAARRNSGHDLIDLTVSNPTAVGLDFPNDWTGLLGDQSLLHYEPDPKGLPSARDAIAGYYAERAFARDDSDRGGSVDPDDLFLTAGTSEGYAHLFRMLCEPGDTILAPRPSYPLLETLADIAGLTLETYPLVHDESGGAAGEGFHAWSPDREALTAQITPHTRVLCVVQPNNPTGSVLSPDDAAWLLDFAAKHNLAIIVDEVFADFRHDRGTTSLPASTGPLVFTLNGLSKLVGLPQLKLAWIHVAGNVEDKARAKDLLEWICDAHLSVGTAPQLAAPELLRRRDEFQGPIRQRLAGNLSILRELAMGNTRLQPLWPQGGWCMPVRCSGIGDDERFAIRLVETEGVMVQPGYFFDFDDEETIVVSLLPEPEMFREGLTRLVRGLA
jgi:alanine-synthesizing transaminase